MCRKSIVLGVALSLYAVSAITMAQAQNSVLPAPGGSVSGGSVSGAVAPGLPAPDFTAPDFTAPGSPGASDTQMQAQGPAAQRNSPYCGFTFFGNGPDSLDFRGMQERRCFDMKGGDDVIILNRGEFPSGVQVFTGTGRDTVWATVGDDEITDPDGEDVDIRTFGGDDVVMIDTMIDKDPFRGIGSTSRTDVSMGSGKNRLVIGGSIKSTAVSRYSPNIWMSTQAKASDTVEAVCGHPTLDGDFDLRTIEVAENSSIELSARGCHIGLFGLYGNAGIDMEGGRLALQTYSEGFRVAEGVNQPTITGEVRGGMSLTMDMDKSSPASDFIWEGQGAVFVRTRLDDAASGGHFSLRTARDIHYVGDMSRADVAFDLVAQGSIRLDLVARGSSGANRFSLAAPRMEISWRLAGDGEFPLIVNTMFASYPETSFVLPDIDWTSAPMMGGFGGGINVTDPDTTVNMEAPTIPIDYETVVVDRKVVPGLTRLRLILRRENDSRARCVSLRAVDTDGLRPDVHISCTSVIGPLRDVLIEEAQDYESLHITGDGSDMVIEINGSSRFRVDRIEAEL